MLKNKTKEQLLELLYQTNNENYALQICNDKQAEILRSIAKVYHKKGFFARLYNFFALPYRILQVLKKSNEYFYTIKELKKMNLTREQVVAAQKSVLDFENQKIATSDYQKIVIEMLGLPKNCPTCSDVTGRLHDDFQKRITAEAVAKYPDLLPTPPTLKSGQFCGDAYKEWMRTYHFRGLTGLLSNMKTASLNAKQRGALEQAKIMLDDCERLKEFIAARKLGLETGEETTGYVDLDTDNELIVKLALTDEEIENFENDFKEKESSTDNSEVVSIAKVSDSETNEAEKEKIAYNDAEALLLQSKGMNLTDLGLYYGINASTVKRKLDKYKEALAAKEETPNE